MTSEDGPRADRTADRSVTTGGTTDRSGVADRSEHDDDPERSDRTDGNGDSPSDPVRPHQAPPSETFGWRGWVLVCVVIVAFLVVPVALLYLPRAQALVASLGLTLRDAYLVLPLVPAFLLGVTAVWAALRSRSD
jgi:hypothetical protein